MPCGDESLRKHHLRDKRHLSIMGRPACAERTVRSVRPARVLAWTGWKVRLRHGGRRIDEGDRQTHPVHDLTTPPNLQVGGGDGDALDDNYFSTLAATCSASAPSWATRWRTSARGAAAHGTLLRDHDYGPLGLNAPTRISAVTSPARRALPHAVRFSAFMTTLGGAAPFRALLLLHKHDTTLDSAIDRMSRHFGS